MQETEKGSAAVPVLNCSSANNPLSTGMLARLLAGEDPLPYAYTAACVQLCGHMTVMCSSFSGRADFFLLLQSLTSVEQLEASGAGRDQVQEQALACIEWLHCLECYTHRYVVQHPAADRARSCDLAEVLATQLGVVAGHLDPLECLLNRSTGHQQSCAYHVTRLALHIHWTALSVAYRLAPLVGWSWFLRQAQSSVSALLSHAASLPPSPSLPGCHCVTQLWLLLRHTMDGAAASTAHPATSFWSVVTSLICEILNPSQPNPDNGCGATVISPSDAVTFSWWCVEQLALLYGYSEEGRQVERDFPSHWDLVHHLLPFTFRQASSEGQLRCALRVCVSLCGMWSPSVLPVTSAWDYYYKHMDDPFVTTAQSISEWATPEGSSPQQWLQYLLYLFHSTDAQSHSHTATLEPRPPADVSNSFQLFLHLIHVTIATGGDGATWRHLKGRFYSKLHRRWLSERKGVGLRRVLSLLLTLAWSGDSREVAMKTVALLSQVGLGEALEHTHLLWRAVFAMLLLLEVKGEGLGDIISRLYPAFSSLAKPHPPESRDHQWKALCVVLDGTLEALESAKGIALGGGALIGSHLSDLLTYVEGYQVTQVLNFVESLTMFLTPSSSSLPLPSQHHTTVCQLLWQHCSQPLLSLSRLPLPPSPLPSTLASLTALTSHQQHTSHLPPPLTIFNEVTKDSVNSTFASSYLSHVIESDIIRHHVLAADNVQVQALHVWLRCLAELDHTPSPSLSTPSHTAALQLTHLLHKLPMVMALLGNQTTPNDPMSVLQQLLVAMETSYRELGGCHVWRERVASILGDLPRYLEPSVSGSRGLAAVKHAYRVAGLVVAKCPRLTYSRTDSRCLLPRLVGWLALPLPSSTKPQPQGAGPALRSQLHLFLSGLLQLEPDRDDFIRRKVRELFTRYFCQSLQPPSPLLPSSPNPFMLALRPWFQDGFHGDGEQLRLVMDVIVSQHLMLPQQPASLSPTLQFIKNVVERVQSPLLLVTMTPSLLSHMTSCLLACDVCPSDKEPPAIRGLVMSILTPLITACREHQDQLPCSSLLPPLRNFLASSASVDQALVTRPLMTLGKLYPDLLQQLVLLLRDDERMQPISHALQNRLSS